jgi:hypothetical protein
MNENGTTGDGGARGADDAALAQGGLRHLRGELAELVALGFYPIVTSHYISPTLYQISYHIRWRFF